MRFFTKGKCFPRPKGLCSNPWNLLEKSDVLNKSIAKGNFWQLAEIASFYTRAVWPAQRPAKPGAFEPGYFTKAERPTGPGPDKIVTRGTRRPVHNTACVANAIRPLLNKRARRTGS
jgi:hypothetical protein